MPTVQLSPHFTLAELTHSDTALAEGIDNTPSQAAIDNLERLAMFLERVRETLGGRPLIITSGYRSPALNEAIGGVRNSAHLFGCAADFVAPAVGSPLAICCRIRGTPALDYDQLINEANASGARWVHLGIAQPGATPRGEVWTVESGRTRPGL